MAVNPQDVIGLGGQTAGVQVGGVTTTLPDVAEGGVASESTSVSIQAALDSLALFLEEFEGIRVVGSLINSAYDPNGTLYDTIDLRWEIIGRPGVFTSAVPFALNWTAIAFFQITLKANTVELIYEGAPDTSVTPSVFLTPPPPSNPPQPIPRPGQPIYV